MRHLLLPLLLGSVVLLSGCAGQSLTQADREAARHPKQALTAAAVHRRRGDWASAVKILEEAASRFPDNGRLKGALLGLQAAWAREKESLRDRMLLQDARCLHQQLMLSKELARLDPGELAAQTTLLALKLRLRGKLEQLGQCAQHTGQSLALRRSCAQMAWKIEPDLKRKERFTALDRKYQAQVARWRARNARKEAELGAKRQKTLLSKAQALVQSGRYTTARPLLEELLAADPDNRLATDLMIRLQSGLKGQVDTLLQLGDTLYREGKLQEAVTAWETVLTLLPGQPDAESKIARARHVLDKLERLRRQQRQ